MTRQEFLDDIESFSDLREFCWDERLSTCDYIRDCEEIDEYIDELLYEYARTDGWKDIRGWLNNIDDSYDWYDTENGITGLSQLDFDDYKQRVLEEADADEVWDEEDGEEEGSYIWHETVVLQRDIPTDVDDEVDAEELLVLAIKTA